MFRIVATHSSPTTGKAGGPSLRGLARVGLPFASLSSPVITSGSLTLLAGGAEKVTGAAGLRGARTAAKISCLLRRSRLRRKRGRLFLRLA